MYVNKCNPLTLSGLFQVDATVETVEDVSYVTPTIPPESSSSVYLAEHFDDPTNFKRKWIKSETKKEGIDEEIAKYDGMKLH